MRLEARQSASCRAFVASAVLCVGLLAGVLSGSFALCGEAQAGAYDTPFTQKELARFMRAWPTFVSWAGKNDVVFEDEDSPIGYIWDDKITEYLAEKDWKAERFFTVAHRASLALVNLQMRRMNLKNDDSVTISPPFVNDNPHISEPQKRMMSADAEDIFGRSTGRKIRISDSEIHLVLPHEERLFRMLLR